MPRVRGFDSRNQNPAGWAQWDEKKRDLILAMARNVGLGREITTADVLRTYQPTFIGKQERLAMLELDIRLAQAEAAARQMNLPIADALRISPPPLGEISSDLTGLPLPPTPPL